VPQYDADGNETGWTLITQDDLAEFGGYLTSLSQWATSAQSCLEVR
jgi:hypothetical protein